MNTKISFPPICRDAGLLVLRLSVGGLMLFHGIYKLAHSTTFAGADSFIGGLLASHGLPAFLSYGVPLGEVVAPLLIIFGVCTRISSALIAFTMAMSLFLVFGADTFALSMTGGLSTEVNFLYLLGAVALFLAGPGRLSCYRGENAFLI